MIGTISVSIVLYIDGTFLKKGIPIRPVYSEYCTPYRMLYRVRYRVRISWYRIRYVLYSSDIKSLWIKLWHSAKRGCKNPGLVALRLFSAGVMQPGQRELPLRSEWHLVNVISFTISTPIFYDITFDIEREKDLRYRIWYQYAISNNVRSISKAWNLDIDIPVHDLRYRRFVTLSISNNHLETPESLDMVYTWYILCIYF